MIVQQKLSAFDGRIPFKITKMLMEDTFSLKNWLLEPDNEGRTALHLAVKEKGNEAVVKLLLDYGDKFALTFRLNGLRL